MKIFEQTGKYFLFLRLVFSKPEKSKFFFKQVVNETILLGINSIGIVLMISAFMGAVIAIQTAYNMAGPFLPKSLIAFVTRETIILEFSSTIVCLILAGKIGSNIASEIGMMRVTEQIDALEVMGINSASYLVLPKIVALTLIISFLYIISAFIGILGGLIASLSIDSMTVTQFVEGLQFKFKPFYITYSIIKSLVFAFVITSVAAFWGYYVKGGAIEVGKSSTKAVVACSMLVLIFNLILTQIFLT